MSDTCHLCHKPEFIDVSGLCRTIQECDRCQHPVCSDCADVDADYQGEEDGYRQTQYQCPQDCAEKHWERRVTDIAVYQERRQFTNRGKAA